MQKHLKVHHLAESQRKKVACVTFKFSLIVELIITETGFSKGVFFINLTRRILR